ncbi:MAG: hypothetical protein H5T83_14065 [Actinotalea sp.]|nr:hypothetical protein [Actinotalea sp.]
MPPFPEPPGVPARAPRWRAPLAVVVVALVLLGGAWWARPTTAPEPPPAAGPPASAPAAPQERPPSGTVSPDPVPSPSAEVAALAEEAFLSEEGRELFFRAEPEILAAAEFVGRCDGPTLRVRTGAVGCFTGSRIIVYAPADARLRGFVVETVAHETLHAAWEVLDRGVQQELTALLEAELAQVPADRTIHEQLAASVGERPQSRPTELFAYVGTQVWRDGGLAAPLEEAYARFVTDRAALVAVHTGWRGMLDAMRADAEAAQNALLDRRTAHAQRRAQHAADTAAVASYRQAYEAKAAEVAAMPPQEQERLQLSWTWWDGTDLPMAPAADTLGAAARLLARDDDALAGRSAELADEEAALAAEQDRVDALVADFRALTAQLDPTT